MKDLYPIVFYSGPGGRRKEFTNRGIAVLHELEITQAGLPGRKVLKRYPDGSTILAVTTENDGMRNDFLTVNVPYGKAEVTKQEERDAMLIPVPEVYVAETSDPQGWRIGNQNFGFITYGNSDPNYTAYDLVYESYERIVRVQKGAGEGYLDADEARLIRWDTWSGLSVDESEGYIENIFTTYAPVGATAFTGCAQYGLGSGCFFPGYHLLPWACACGAWPNYAIFNAWTTAYDPSGLATDSWSAGRQNQYHFFYDYHWFYFGYDRYGDPLPFRFVEGELKDHYTHIHESWDNDPYYSVCAGVIIDNYVQLVEPMILNNAYNEATGDCAIIMDKYPEYTIDMLEWGSDLYPQSTTGNDGHYTSTVLWFNGVEYEIWRSPYENAADYYFYPMSYKYFNESKDVKIYKYGEELVVVFSVICGRYPDPNTGNFVYDNCVTIYGMLFKGRLFLSEGYPTTGPEYLLSEHNYSHDWPGLFINDIQAYGKGYIHAAVKYNYVGPTTKVED